MNGTPLGGLLKIVVAVGLAFAWSQGLLSGRLASLQAAFTTPRTSSGSITVFGQTIRTAGGPALTSAPAPGSTTPGGTA
jgi:hypothetical protein